METLVERICAKEGLKGRNIRTLSGGQVNQVFRIGEEYVLRIGAREDAFQRLKQETQLLQSLNHQKHYPALFETPHLRQRVNLYHLVSALSSYLAWRKDNLSAIPPDRMAAKEFYMARITNFIFRHGTRMFYA